MIASLRDTVDSEKPNYSNRFYNELFTGTRDGFRKIFIIPVQMPYITVLGFIHFRYLLNWKYYQGKFVQTKYLSCCLIKNTKINTGTLYVLHSYISPREHDIIFKKYTPSGQRYVFVQ